MPVRRRTLTHLCNRALNSLLLGGAKYAMMGSDTKLCETRVWVPWFEHKEYPVRMVDATRCGLWDVKENRQA